MDVVAVVNFHSGYEEFRILKDEDGRFYVRLFGLVSYPTEVQSMAQQRLQPNPHPFVSLVAVMGYIANYIDVAAAEADKNDYLSVVNTSPKNWSWPAGTEYVKPRK